ILVLDAEFLKGWAGPAEFDVFEAVDFEDIDLPTLLREEMPDYEQRFLTIDLKPFAAGSFAQVYRGQLRDGTAVILKILRPSLVANLKSDLKLLARIARVTGLLFRGGIVDIREIYRQFAASVRDETDYEREARNAGWFYSYFARNPAIVIPRTYAELSSAHIIVQELIGGLSLAEVFQAQSNGHDPALFVFQRVGSSIWTQLETIGTELLIGALTAEYVIGDPHPGNIKLLPDNKVAFLDFGVAAAPPANRVAFLNLLREYEKVYAGNFDMGSFTIAALQFFDEELTGALETVGQLVTPWDPRSLLQKIGDAARRALEDLKAKPQTADLLDQKVILRLFNQNINEKNRFGIAVNVDAADMLKSATTCIKVIRAVGTSEQHLPILHRCLRTAIMYADSGHVAASEPSPRPEPAYAVEFLTSWLAGIADSDPFLYRQITGSMNS
ncbi:MAG TPA: AarF/ABC1/UbiB kinase family protein, partial [Candidatus Saccharimonadales bacterium]|nr:AarF/ABC1/UbiB kinase family protein [Candidatus Saccharimonadales bacterium]